MSTGGAPSIGRMIISARPLAEYLAMFDLDAAALAGRRILDCPGGCASFGAEARALGALVTSADPAYAMAPEVLAERARADVARSNQYVRDNVERYTWPYFESPEAHIRHRTEGCERFVADRATHPEAYVAASLPALPFEDDAFDLALSSHLLFTYADRLGHAFHVSALRELTRVSAGEARVYPLVDAAAAPYPRLDELRSDLRATGVESEVRDVPYEFQRGADRMLVVRRSAPPPGS
jgi:hypothetical protein